MLVSNKLNILIITPSLNPQENISGISTISSLLIQNNKEYNYIPFIVGKKDKQKRGVYWLFNLFKNLFYISFFSNEKLRLVHFNLGLEPKSLIRDILLFFILWIRSAPVILHIHGGRFMNCKAGIFKPIINFFLKKAKTIIVLSDLEKEFLQKNYTKVDSCKINVIPNAVDFPEYIEEKKDFKDKLSFLFLGRIDKAKGLAKIADALKIMKSKQIPFVFNLCGVGPDKDYFLKLLADVQSDVKDFGLVYGNLKKELMMKSHVFILPSDFEGLPLSLLESMGYGMVPVVSPVGSIPNVVNSCNGRLASTIEEIVDAVTELNSDRDMLESLSYAARQTIEKHYSITKFIKDINIVNENLFSSTASIHES